jgi:histidinol phosphatase-like PHP family hydrolase
LAVLPAGFSIALACAVSALAAAGLPAPFQLTGTQCLQKTHEVYQTAQMSSARKGEDKTIIDHGVLIHYMSNEERESSRVVIVNGTLYTSKGKPTPYGTDHEKLNYAMDAAGNFYIFNQTGHPELRHSSFFDGRPVACAGDLEVKNGRIVRINSNSGHYSPSAKMFQNVLIELKKDGVDVTSVTAAARRAAAAARVGSPRPRTFS